MAIWDLLLHQDFRFSLGLLGQLGPNADRVEGEDPNAPIAGSRQPQAVDPPAPEHVDPDPAS